MSAVVHRWFCCYDSFELLPGSYRHLCSLPGNRLTLVDLYQKAFVRQYWVFYTSIKYFFSSKMLTQMEWQHVNFVSEPYFLYAKFIICTMYDVWLILYKPGLIFFFSSCQWFPPDLCLKPPLPSFSFSCWWFLALHVYIVIVCQLRSFAYNNGKDDANLKHALLTVHLGLSTAQLLHF